MKTSIEVRIDGGFLNVTKVISKMYLFSLPTLATR